MRSHKSLLEHASTLDVEAVLIMEDDIDFCDDFNYKLNLCLNELPENWDALHLGGYSPSGCLIHYSPMLNRSIKTWGGYGYIVNKKSIPKLIEEISKELTQVDTHYTWIMHSMNWFKTKEMLIYHLPGYSEIDRKKRDIKELYIVKKTTE